MVELTALGIQLEVGFAMHTAAQVVHTSFYCVHIDWINWQSISVPCTWNAWGSWTSCTKTCGSGTKTRTRSKNGPYHGGSDCSGSSSESPLCNTNSCPGELSIKYFVMALSWPYLESSWCMAEFHCWGGPEHHTFSDIDSSSNDYLNNSCKLGTTS